MGRMGTITEAARAARAYRSEICLTALDILAAIASDYAREGDPGSDLRDAPEYLINVHLAQGLVRAFPTMRYRLEHRASAFDDMSRTAIDSGAAIGKDLARFDIVLLNRSNNVPRYIIEVKRGAKILNDATRIISMAAQQSGRKRWRHGFLIAILRRDEDAATRAIDKLTDEIKAMRTTFQGTLPEHQFVKVNAMCKRVGASRLDSPKKSIYGAVFHLALCDKRVSDDDDEDDAPDNLA